MTAVTDSKTLITFWGTRGSVSTPGRTTEKYGGNTPCIGILYEDIHIILDAGTGIRNLGIELAQDSNKEKGVRNLHLFLSHTHWDHIQGLPFFQPAYNKDTKLIIYGSPKKERFLESILRDQMDYEYFPVAMSTLTADITIQEMSQEVIHLGPVIVDWQEQVFHPGGSVRYRLGINGKKIVYATDVELNLMLDKGQPLQNRRDLVEDYMKFTQSADLLIADGQYTGEEYPGKMGWGHTSIPFLLDVAYRAQVKQVAVFHHDPQHSDTFLDDLWIKYRTKYFSRSPSMDIFWAREGMTIAI